MEQHHPFFNKIGDDDDATFQFTLWLEEKDGRISLGRMNDFNARWRFVKGFLDASDNSLSVQMGVDLEGGVSPAYLASRITHWDALIGGFRSFMAPDIAQPGATPSSARQPAWQLPVQR